MKNSITMLQIPRHIGLQAPAQPEYPLTILGQHDCADYLDDTETPQALVLGALYPGCNTERMTTTTSADVFNLIIAMAHK